MAKPIFIYAFDNLGPFRFAELCGLLLGARYKGFILGGIGKDGGIDGEIDNSLGIWCPDNESPLFEEIIPKNSKVVFQFKHKVTSRVGEVNSRKQLLNLFRSSNNKISEVKKENVISLQPNAYVLVTNIEVNSNYRKEFIKICQSENPEIKNYQIIGLDELESWITMEPLIRHHFFPFIFEPPKYNLKLKVTTGVIIPTYTNNIGDPIDVLQIIIYNIGSVTSYLSSIKFRLIKNNTSFYKLIIDIRDNSWIMNINPKINSPLEPGRKLDFQYPLKDISQSLFDKENTYLTEVIITDEIDNSYTFIIDDDLHSKIYNAQYA